MSVLDFYTDRRFFGVEALRASNFLTAELPDAAFGSEPPFKDHSWSLAHASPTPSKLAQ
jgi:hypothetical protein